MTNSVQLHEAVIDERAYRLGMTEQEIRHALAHFIAYGDAPGVIMFLGPRDELGSLIEVAVFEMPTGPRVIHAGMPTRRIGIGAT